MMNRLRNLRWTIIAPVALIGVVLLLVLAFDLAHTGEAKPPALVGALGTPVRGTLVPPTVTPIGAKPTVRPRPTVPGGVAGTPDSRDQDRRNLLLIAVDGLNKLKARDGQYPSTNGNLQTLCNYTDLDKGCKLAEVIPTGVPKDPLGDPVNNGFWYQSDGSYAKLFASMEQDLPEDQRCVTDFADLNKKPNLFCVTVR